MIRRVVEVSLGQLVVSLMSVDVDAIVLMATEMREVIRGGGKILAFGCGGSAADAQHFAAELVGRFVRDDVAHPAMALTDPTTITAIANDFGYDEVFARQIRAHARSGDAVLAISTSGRSDAVIAGAQEATRVGIPVYALTGRVISTNVLARVSDLVFHAPASDTARIQEIHGFVIHMLCEAVDDA